MMITRWSLCLGLLLAGAAFAEQKPQQDAQQRQRTDPIGDNLFRPELLLRNYREVGLSNEQKESIRAESKRAHAQFSGLQRTLRQEVAALGELLRQDSPDEQKVMLQLDKVLDGEREIKRAQLAMTLAIKKMLTPEQQARARELRRKPVTQPRGRGADARQPPESLRAKLQQVQARARAAQQAGRDASAVRPLLREAEPLVREGKFEEASAVLDRAAKLLDEAEKK